MTMELKFKKPSPNGKIRRGFGEGGNGEVSAMGQSKAFHLNQPALRIIMKFGGIFLAVLSHEIGNFLACFGRGKFRQAAMQRIGANHVQVQRNDVIVHLFPVCFHHHHAVQREAAFGVESSPVSIGILSTASVRVWSQPGDRRCDTFPEKSWNCPTQIP